MAAAAGSAAQMPAHPEVVRDAGFAVADQPRLRGGSAHIERYDVGLITQLSQMSSSDYSRRGAGLHAIDGLAGHRRRRHHAAAGLHDLEGTGQAHPAQILLQRLHISGDRRTDVGGDHRSRGPLILTKFRPDLGGKRHITPAADACAPGRPSRARAPDWRRNGKSK